MNKSNREQTGGLLHRSPFIDLAQIAHSHHLEHILGLYENNSKQAR